MLKTLRCLLVLMVMMTIGCMPIKAYGEDRLIQRELGSSVEIHSVGSGGAWSGVIVGRKQQEVYVLSIIHDSDEARFMKAYNLLGLMVRVNGEDIYEAEVVNWNPDCSDLALFRFYVDKGTRVDVSRIGRVPPKLGQLLTNIGNALDAGNTLSRGQASSIGPAMECHVMDGYSGGVTSGRSGSALFNSSGKVIGIIEAMHVNDFPVLDPYTGELVGVGFVGVEHMGLYYPLSVIRAFLSHTFLL